MTEVKMTSGQRVGKYLSDHGIAQAFVADKAGIDRNRFYQITRGSVRIEAEEFLTVCKILEKDPDVLMSYE